MEETMPVIYGLEFQSRCLAARAAETEKVQFLVGTQSLRTENQIHLLEFDDETNSISKSVFPHRGGEVWHLSTSPYDASLFATCYNHATESKAELRAALWRVPADVATYTDDVTTAPPLESVANLAVPDATDVKSVIWHPSGEDQTVAALTEKRVVIFDLGAGQPAVKVDSGSVLTAGGRGGAARIYCAAWSPHHGGSQLALAADTNVKVWDCRANTVAHTIEGAHSQPVRDVDWNPNRQYVLASCGDDGRARVWDIRSPQTPLTVLASHSHWVWSVRYNRFHDQLVLTSSSDSRVLLTNLVSVSSEPYGTLLEAEDEDDVEDEEEEPAGEGKSIVAEDGVLQAYEEHEDSVYCCEWSAADPWLFASLSFDGRLVISRVPRDVKYSILL